MPEGNRRVEYDRLNWLGKTLFWTGAATRLAAEAIDYTLKRTASVVAEAERAFRDGLDNHADDAKILEETEDRRPRKPSS